MENLSTNSSVNQTSSNSQPPTTIPQVTVNIQNSSKSKSPIYFVLLGIVIVLIIIISVNLLQNKDNNIAENQNPTATPISKQQIVESTPETQALDNVVNGSSPLPVIDQNTKQTLCYQFQMPKNSNVDNSNKCLLYLNASTNDFPFSLTVDPIYTRSQYKNIEAAITDRAVKNKILSQKNITIGGLPAIQLIEQTHPTNGDEMYSIYVFTKDKNYMVDSLELDGFVMSSVILNTENKNKQIQYLNNILDSWIWL